MLACVSVFWVGSCQIVLLIGHLKIEQMMGLHRLGIDSMGRESMLLNYLHVYQKVPQGCTSDVSLPISLKIKGLGNYLEII